MGQDSRCHRGETRAPHSWLGGTRAVQFAICPLYRLFSGHRKWAAIPLQLERGDKTAMQARKRKTRLPPSLASVDYVHLGRVPRLGTESSSICGILLLEMARMIGVDGPNRSGAQNRLRSHRHGVINSPRLPESICLVRKWQDCSCRTPSSSSGELGAVRIESEEPRGYGVLARCQRISGAGMTSHGVAGPWAAPERVEGRK